MVKTYIAVIDGPSRLVIVDASTGIRINYINVGGPIVNGPIVVGDRVTVITQKTSGSKMGRIYKMPSGGLITQFNI
jgi:translation initiation factor 6 (eIF-6)